jgi:hypothetical protein
MQQSGLVHAIEKLARAGKQAGMSVEDLIQILTAGISMETLLDLNERSLQASRGETGRSSRRIM